jgi:hypothetical protein
MEITYEEQRLGDFKVKVFNTEKQIEKGQFITRNYDLIQDINTMNDSLIESDLLIHESFEHVVSHCVFLSKTC